LQQQLRINYKFTDLAAYCIKMRFSQVTNLISGSPSAVNTDTGVVDAYQHMAPMVDTVTYMHWLYKQCRDKGCRFVHDGIHGLLGDQAENLKRKYKAQLIIHCSGLSAKELAEDEDVYPLRGE